MDARLLAFIGVSTLLVVTPGPDMAMVTKNALRLGRRGALLTTLGIVTAILFHTTAAALGLSVLLRTASTVFTIVKLCGAAYLLFLGIQALRNSFRHRDAAPNATESPVSAQGHARSAYLQGFLSALLNPKLLVFFATFLPQFVEPGTALLPHMLLLGVIFDMIGLTWLTCYGLFVSRKSDFFRSPTVRRRVERITGAVLLSFGLRLALERT